MSYLLTPKRAIFCASLQATIIASALALTSFAQAQNFTVLHNFTSGSDGAFPEAGLSIDADGRLYGTTSGGGLVGSECNGCGVVFKLAAHDSGWTLTPLHEFRGPNDGDEPIARPVFGPSGVLYGTTTAGGAQFCEGSGCGTAYGLRPGATACTTPLCYWSESFLYSFGGVESICGVGNLPAGQKDTSYRQPGQINASCPGSADLTFDEAGNIYGTVPCCYGVVYQLTPSGTGTTLYNFAGGVDGYSPQSGVIFDRAGNLYGTTTFGGSAECGTVYELSPSGSSWSKKILYDFQCGSDGQNPIGGLIFDAVGNLYGTTSQFGEGRGGTVFELTPSEGNWTFHLLYSLSYTGTFDFGPPGPSGSLTMDAAGNLYGTAVLDGAFASGSVFKLTQSDGSWTYTSLHDFTSGNDGGNPYGNVVFDASGNLYGTASLGGSYRSGIPCENQGCGVVWEITP